MPVLLAREYHWTPEQIARMDEDFIMEILARIRAENDVERARQRREQRRRGAAERQSRTNGEGEDADV